MKRILAVLALAFAPLLAFAQETPDALVKRTTDEVLAIIKADKDIQSGNMTKVVQLAEQKVLPHFDFERMTRLAVGRNWSAATPTKRLKGIPTCSCAPTRRRCAVPQPDDRGEAPKIAPPTRKPR
jgi:ABC-type transporter MlaC component